MTILNVNIKKLLLEAVIPTYAKSGDAGLDLTATTRWFDDAGNVCYGTGLAIEIPEGYYADLRPRSSISKYDLTLANSVGTIDSNYRGELIFKFKPTPAFFDRTPCSALTTETFDFVALSEKNNMNIYEVGDRIGQILIKPYPKITFIEVDQLSDSDRGEQGFGSTGK
jgi:dUTP pyrophosphatase